MVFEIVFEGLFEISQANSLQNLDVIISNTTSQLKNT